MCPKLLGTLAMQSILWAMKSTLVGMTIKYDKARELVDGGLVKRSITQAKLTSSRCRTTGVRHLNRR